MRKVLYLLIILSLITISIFVFTGCKNNEGNINNGEQTQLELSDFDLPQIFKMVYKVDAVKATVIKINDDWYAKTKENKEFFFQKNQTNYKRYDKSPTAWTYVSEIPFEDMWDVQTNSNLPFTFSFLLKKDTFTEQPVSESISCGNIGEIVTNKFIVEQEGTSYHLIDTYWMHVDYESITLMHQALRDGVMSTYYAETFDLSLENWEDAGIIPPSEA